MLEVNVVVVDKGGGHGDERDVAREAAVVEPIDVDRGDAVDEAGGIDGDDDEVAARVEGGGDLAVEGSEASLVVADAFPVDPHEGAVVGRTDVEKVAGAGFGLRLEVALVPDDAFEAEEGWVLRVPVAGNLQRGCGGEVVLVVMRAAGDVGVGVLGVAVVLDRAVCVVQVAGRRLIDEVVPVAIERGDGAMIDTDEKRVQRRLRRGGTESGARKKEQRGASGVFQKRHGKSTFLFC